MRIQHAIVAPLNPDTLIAIHMIADLVDRWEERGSERIDRKMTKEDLEYLRIEALLWGCISFGNPIRESFSDQYASLWTPTIGEVLQIFHERGLDDLKCMLDVTPETIKRYEQSPAFEYITTDVGWLSDEQAVEAWRKVKEQSKQPLRLLLLPLRECYSLCSAILDARNAEFHEALRSVNGLHDHTHMLRLRESKPIRFDFPSVAGERIRDTLRAAEQEYLDAFMADRIRWLNDTPKWQWQLEKVLSAIQARARHFAQFWISIADADFRDERFPGNNDYYLTCSCRLVETLLALSFQKTIDILEIAPITCSLPDAIPKKVGLRFRIVLHEVPTGQTATAPHVVPQPVLTLARNERTGELLMNGKHLITPHSGWSGDRLMEELFKRNKNSRIVKLTEADILIIKDGKKYPISNILTNLGFTGDLREAFFPTSSNNAVIFVNPVFESDLKQHGITCVPELSRVE